MALNPAVAPGGNFDLSNWKITLPVDANGGFSGNAMEVKNLSNYQNPKYFYTAADGAMTFVAPVQGATTSGSSYSRSELREMNGTANAAWNLNTGGFMSATLEVDAAPNRDGMGGRIIVGQIHGKDDELVRLYWENGKLYFANDHAGSNNSETKFYFVNASGQQPSVSLDERFSYTINAKGDTLEVTVFADGQIYKSVNTINSVWQSDSFYFKAGAYLGANETNGSGYGQTSFYALSVNHNGTVTTQTQPTPTPTATDDPVTSADDVYAATEDANLTISASQGVLANDTAPDGGKIATAGAFTTAQGGSVKLNADGSFVYTPKADFSGSDSFSYTARDADGDTDAGTVTFKVANVAESTTLPTTSLRPTTTKILTGTSSGNKLTGSSRSDKIDGKSGNDMLWGKGGNDILVGGSGKDSFSFDTKPGAKNVDVILDFSVKDDTIRLNDLAFTKLKYGKLSSSSFVIGDKALDSMNQIIYNKKTGALLYDADGTGKGAAIRFATVDAHLKMTSADFIVI
jgi:Ca2+-binding RTX toxin-like protein